VVLMAGDVEGGGVDAVGGVLDRDIGAMFHINIYPIAFR
jgi:hypothetical protein